MIDFMRKTISDNNLFFLRYFLRLCLLLSFYLLDVSSWWEILWNDAAFDQEVSDSLIIFGMFM